jgi:protein ImuB
MRICAVSLPELRIELIARSHGHDDAPLAVVVAPPPMTEAKLLGGTRLSVVSREARALGVAPGQTIAQARARAGELAVRVVRPDAVRDVLACLAEVGLAFGATVSFSTEHGDVVWIDVTGCAHLHVHTGGSIFDGETILASRLMGAITSLGHTCSVAIADGPRIAAMLAQASAEASALAERGRGRRSAAVPAREPIVVRSGENADAIASLSVSYLPLEADDIRWLTKIGVRTIHELRALPRAGLGARLGPRARDVIALAFGDDRAPLSPYVPPEVPEEDAELEYGVEGSQALTFVAKTLTDRLASRLAGRAVATSRLELELRLDAALRQSEKGKDRETVALDLPAPLSTASDLLAALRPKIERLALSAPVLGAKLRAPVLVHKRAAAMSLFEPQPKAERALPRLVAELASDLGESAVTRLELVSSWIPEERSRLVPFGRVERPKTKRQRRMLSSVPEPTRLLAEPRDVTRDAVRVTRHLSRLESVAWWMRAPSPMNKRSPVDYVQGWTDDGAAWLSIDRATGAMRILGWFD